MITVYGRPGCMACRATKRQLDTLDVPYRYFDADKLTHSAREWLRNLGFQELPIIVVRDPLTTRISDSWAGHRPERIDALVDRLA